MKLELVCSTIEKSLSLDLYFHLSRKDWSNLEDKHADMHPCFFYAPNFEKVGDILVSACRYVCVCVCVYVFMF